MAQATHARRWHAPTRIAVLLAAVGIGVAGCGGGDGSGISLTAEKAAAAACAARENNTVDKLLECVTLDGVHSHQAAFQAIADANNGIRTSGTPGYNQSVDYVAGKLEAAGYDVTVQPSSTRLSSCSRRPCSNRFRRRRRGRSSQTSCRTRVAAT